jgi:hypothetical protein
MNEVVKAAAVIWTGPSVLSFDNETPRHRDRASFCRVAVEVNNSSQQRLCLADGKYSCRNYSRRINSAGALPNAAA